MRMKECMTTLFVFHGLAKIHKNTGKHNGLKFDNVEMYSEKKYDPCAYLFDTSVLTLMEVLDDNE